MSRESDRTLAAWLMTSSADEGFPSLDALVEPRPLWMSHAACKGEDVNTFFPGRGETPRRTGRRICAGCPVRDECYHYAASFTDAPAGVWGGESERQRKRFGVVA